MWILLACACTGLFILAMRPGVVSAQSPTVVPTATMSAEDILAEAQAVSTQAEQASNAAAQSMNQVNLVLSLIQVGGLFATTLGAIAAGVGLLSTAQYRRRMNGQIKSLSARMLARR